jgi:hypothetical protein
MSMTQPMAHPRPGECFQCRLMDDPPSVRLMASAAIAPSRFAGRRPKPPWRNSRKMGVSKGGSAPRHQAPKSTVNNDRLAQLRHRSADDYSCTLQGERRHDCRHDNIRPTFLGAEHACRSQQYGEISEHIVPSANPSRPHIGVPAGRRRTVRKWLPVSAEPHTGGPDHSGGSLPYFDRALRDEGTSYHYAAHASCSDGC